MADFKFQFDTEDLKINKKRIASTRDGLVCDLTRLVDCLKMSGSSWNDNLSDMAIAELNKHIDEINSLVKRLTAVEIYLEDIAKQAEEYLKYGN